MHSGFDHITVFHYSIDETAHIDDAGCWCVPEVEDYGEGYVVITHNVGVC